MIRRSLLLAVTAAAIAASAAGCGSSSSSSTSSSAPATSTSAPATTTGASAYGSATSSNPAVVQAVAACKQRINAAQSLSASLKSKLIAVCDKAASGDESGARKAAAQVCTEIIKATVPQSVQAQALAGCPKA